MSEDPWDSADNMKVFFINPQEDLMQVVMAEILGDVIEKNPDFDLADFRIEFDKIKGERVLIKRDDWERPWPPVDKDAFTKKIEDFREGDSDWPQIAASWEYVFSTTCVKCGTIIMSDPFEVDMGKLQWHS